MQDRDIKIGVAELSTHDGLDQKLMHLINLVKESSVDEKWEAIDHFILINKLREEDDSRNINSPDNVVGTSKTQ